MRRVLLHILAGGSAHVTTLPTISCLFALCDGFAEPGTRRFEGVLSLSNELSVHQAR